MISFPLPVFWFTVNHESLVCTAQVVLADIPNPLELEAAAGK